jgi:TolB protein
MKPLAQIHQLISSRNSRFSLTPCFSWVFGSRDDLNFFNGLWRAVETLETISAHLFSAKGAVSFQPGATSQEKGKSEDLGLKARPVVPAINRLAPAINRAFSALYCKQSASWGVAPGWNRVAPLALNTDVPAVIRPCISQLKQGLNERFGARRRQVREISRLIRPIALLSLSLILPQSFGQEEFDIYKSGKDLIRISLAGFSGEVLNVLKFDLDVAGFTNVNPEVAQYNISGSNNGQVEGRVTDRISKATVLAVRYTDANPRTQAHAFADDIVLKLTGKPGIARTKIAFKGVRSDSGEIYIADYDGANAVPVTADRAVVAAPCWVPGRRMLYYHSYKSGFPDIYSHDLSTRERKIIAQHPGINISPAISPDRTKVAMILSFRGSPDLYVCDASGGNVKQLTKTKEDESSPCWSPDGSTICYVSSESGTPALYLISANGDNKRKLRTTGAPRGMEPDWSPDGKSIAFTTMFGGFAICVVPAQGGDAPVLATGEDPSWAPNSRTLIFTRREKGRSVLSLLDVPTKRVKDVGQNSGSSSQPSWAK